MKIFFFFYFLLLNYIRNENNKICENLVKVNSTETHLKEVIQKNFDIIKNDPKCIEVLLRQGFLSSSEYFLSELMRNKINFKENLNIAISKINYQFDEILNKFKFGGGDILKATPATTWAQSLSHIYLQIKFSHLHDAPGCLEVTKDSLVVNNDSLVFIGFCAIGDFPIKFNLTLNLYDNVTLEESTIEKTSSVGRIVLTLKKNNAPMYWKGLQKETVPHISSIKIWYDMKYRFMDELREYENDDNQEEEELEEKEAVKGRRRRKKQFKDKKIPQSEFYMENNNLMPQ